MAAARGGRVLAVEAEVDLLDGLTTTDLRGRDHRSDVARLDDDLEAVLGELPGAADDDAPCTGLRVLERHVDEPVAGKLDGELGAVARPSTWPAFGVRGRRGPGQGRCGRIARGNRRGRWLGRCRRDGDRRDRRRRDRRWAAQAATTRRRALRRGARTAGTWDLENGDGDGRGATCNDAWAHPNGSPAAREFRPSNVHARAGRATRSASVERGVELRRVRPEPAAPRGMVRDAGLEQRPERPRVPEDAQVAQLVGDDRLERRRRGEDEAPRERQRPAPRAAAPARGRVADRDAPRRDPERVGVAERPRRR